MMGAVRVTAIGLVAAVLLMSAAAAQPARPVRVMSISMCTDQLVLALVPPERITSVTWLSRDPSGSVMIAEAARVGVNYGQAEEVLRDHPDLVLAGTFATPVLRGMLRRLGYPLLEVEEASNFDQIRTITRQVGDAVGERDRAEALIARMDADLASLRLRPNAWRPRVVAWTGGGAVEGVGTLLNAVIEAAGGRNIATEEAFAQYGSFDVEALIDAAPDILIEDDERVTRPDLRRDAARHPFTRRYYANRRISLPRSLYGCGTPMSARAAIDLRRQFDRIERTVGRGPAYRSARAP